MPCTPSNSSVLAPSLADHRAIRRRKSRLISAIFENFVQILPIMEIRPRNFGQKGYVKPPMAPRHRSRIMSPMIAATTPDSTRHQWLPGRRRVFFGAIGIADIYPHAMAIRLLAVPGAVSRVASWTVSGPNDHLLTFRIGKVRRGIGNDAQSLRGWAMRVWALCGAAFGLPAHLRALWTC